MPSSVCGHDVVNAGIGDMTVGSYLPLAKQLLAGRRVQSVVIALGTNDFGIASSAHIEKDYANLIDELAKHATNILLAGLPPFERSGKLAGRYFDQASADRNNAAIRSLAAARNLPFVDLRSAMHGDGLTVDGIHLTAVPTNNGARPSGATFIQRSAASSRMAPRNSSGMFAGGNQHERIVLMSKKTKRAERELGFLRAAAPASWRGRSLDWPWFCFLLIVSPLFIISICDAGAEGNCCAARLTT